MINSEIEVEELITIYYFSYHLFGKFGDVIETFNISAIYLVCSLFKPKLGIIITSYLTNLIPAHDLHYKFIC